MAFNRPTMIRRFLYSAFVGIKIIIRQVYRSFTQYLGKEGGLNLAWANFMAVSYTCLLRVTNAPIRPPQALLNVGNCIHQYYMIIHALQMHGADVLAFIAKLAVCFIGKQVKIMVDNDLLQGFHFLPAIEVAGGIVRIAQYNGLCFGTNGLLKITDRRRAKPVSICEVMGFTITSAATANPL